MTDPSPVGQADRLECTVIERGLNKQTFLPDPEFGDNRLNRWVVLKGLLNAKDEAAVAGRLSGSSSQR